MSQQKRQQTTKEQKKFSQPTHPARNFQPNSLQVLPQHIQGDSVQVSPQNVLALQRMIGNQAVQRVLAAQPPAVRQQAPSRAVQRVKGLRQAGYISDFAQKAHGYVQKNQRESIDSLLKYLKSELDNMFDSLNLYPIKMLRATGQGTGDAHFSGGTWGIAVNVKGSLSLKEAKQLQGDGDKSLIETLIDSVYHEARHAEQRFRALKFIANPLVLANSKKELEDRASDDELAQQMVDDKNVDDVAIAKHAIDHFWDADDDAKPWYWSMIKYEKYNQFIQNDMHEVTSSIKDTTDQLKSLNKTKEKDKGEGREIYKDTIKKKPGKIELIELIDWWFIKGGKKLHQYRKHFNPLFKILKKDVKDLDEHAAKIKEIKKDIEDVVPSGSDEGRFQNHMTGVLSTLEKDITNLQTAVKNKRKETYKKTIDDVYAAADKLRNDYYTEYENLPEEVDAYATGHKAAEAYSEYSKRQREISAHNND